MSRSEVLANLFQVFNVVTVQKMKFSIKGTLMQI